MSETKKVAVFISGRGSNLLKILESATHYQISHVFSDNPTAKGLEYAKLYDVPAEAYEKKSELYDAVRKHDPDFIALAGYMSIISKSFVEEYYGRMINIHPSLLPKFPGLDTHGRAIEAAEKEHGATVHFVDQGVDTGPLIAQAKCPLFRDDSSETLADRVVQYEHKIYPWVLNHFAAGNISLHTNRKVLFDPIVIQEGKERDFKVCI